MLDNYIQGFEEARQFIQHHYDALPMPMQNNPNRFKHGNRCPQGKYWVQPPGKKGFCRATGKRKGGMSNPQPMQVQKKRKLTWQNKMTSKGSQTAGKIALAVLASGAGIAAYKGLKSLPNAVVKPKTEKQKWEEKRSQIINQGSKDLDNLLN